MVDSDLLAKYKKEKKEWKKSEGSFTRYPALTTISGLLKSLAIIASMVIVVSFLYTVSTIRNENLIWALVPSYIGAIIATICIYAYGELITLFIDIEQNTRKG